MGQASKAIHEHHQQLMQEISAQIKAIIEREPCADPERLAAFLKEELLPHALGEERQFYPVLDKLVAEHGKPTATMSIDHEYIEGYIDWIKETADELESADGDEREELLVLLGHLCVRLEAVLQLHIAKEERIYLPLFEQYVPEAEQQRVLDAMHNVEVADPEAEEREPLYAHKDTAG